ncbi:MAG: hypothetical protein WAM83_02135, partial [Bradyrhizobium sp.]
SACNIWRSGIPVFSKNISNDFFRAGRQLITQTACFLSTLIALKTLCGEVLAKGHSGRPACNFRRLILHCSILTPAQIGLLEQA